MPRESKDDRWYRSMTEQSKRHDKELELVRFRIKEQLWDALEPNFRKRIPCDMALAERLCTKVDVVFDNIDLIRRLNKKEQEATK